MRRLVWSGPARSDLFAIAGYYERIDPELPIRLLQKVETAPLLLVDNPQLGAPTSRGGVRKWSIRGTPFLLLYAVGRDRVEIGRVVHNSTNWRSEP